MVATAPEVAAMGYTKRGCNMPTVRQVIKIEDQIGRHIYDRPSAGILCWIVAYAKITFKNGREFAVGITGGTNGGGIYGHNGNGVFVGDDASENIVITGQATYEYGVPFTPTKEQIALYRRLLSMSWREFKAWVNGNEIEQRPPFIGRRFTI